MTKRPTNKFVRKAIRDIMEPEIRTLGFEGKYPAFKRIENGEIHFLEISVAKYGGSFGIGLSWCANAPLEHAGGEIIPEQLIERAHIPFEQSASIYPLMGVWTLDGTPLRVSSGGFDYSLMVEDELACRALVAQAKATLPQADAWLKTRSPQELVFLAGQYPPTGYTAEFKTQMFLNKEEARLRKLGLIE